VVPRIGGIVIDRGPSLLMRNKKPG